MINVTFYFHFLLLVIFIAYIALGISFIRRYNTINLSNTIKIIFLLGYLAILGSLLYIILFLLFLGVNS